MELFDQNGCLTEEGLHAVIGGQPDEQKRFMMMCTYKMLALPDAGVPEL